MRDFTPPLLWRRPRVVLRIRVVVALPGETPTNCWMEGAELTNSLTCDVKGEKWPYKIQNNSYEFHDLKQLDN